MKTNNKIEKLYTERASFYEQLFVDFLGWDRELEFFFDGQITYTPTLRSWMQAVAQA